MVLNMMKKLRIRVPRGQLTACRAPDPEGAAEAELSTTRFGGL